MKETIEYYGGALLSLLAASSTLYVIMKFLSIGGLIHTFVTNYMYSICGQEGSMKQVITNFGYFLLDGTALVMLLVLLFYGMTAS